MLFLVTNTPHPSKLDDAKNARMEFRPWINGLESKNKVICFYPRVGRDSIAILDVSSNDEFHALMTEWLTIVPVSFDIFPLANPSEAEELLK